MRRVIEHDWKVTPEEAVGIQSGLAHSVVCEDQLPGVISTVAGVDVAYDTATGRLFAGVVVLDTVDLKTADEATSEGQAGFAYVPGLFSFRELPPLCDALDKLGVRPDLIVCDGHGISHPRRFGLASHLGVLYDVPTIGCAKTCFVGTYSQPGHQRGDFAPLFDRGEVVGCVLRTRDHVKPLFVSIGHRVSLTTAVNWILQLSADYRQPEPIRAANTLVNSLRRSHSLNG